MILIIGGNGQLGTELRYLLDEHNAKYISTNSEEMDITNAKETMAVIKKIQPSIIYHCAAYTAVDKAEGEGKELNELTNVRGTKNVVLAAKSVGAKLVYISTDYVFDGTLKNEEYTENSITNPQNKYGRAKLLGEQAVKKELTDYYIIRTSWVFGQYGQNFVFTMLKLAETHDVITVVNDQFGRPTWTRTLAEFMTFLVNEGSPYGVYHLSNEDSCTWYEFAKEILQHKSNVELRPISSDEYPQKAKRPQYSIMSLDKAEKLNFEIPTWKDALQNFFKNGGG
ncbi:MAG: dTDP-4-dehydrorhamnose reductase [Staphylococcus equorum]|uniref:dTDP-4-dehydrorhamnose reductase n=1 Tax=Tetragenococcus halophilus TaxID=51669 RepID=UPI00264B8D47|nr:dTDP-4-dehydrorhamnose reductase [Staphylococcus equorum]MDN6267626.1 dTDP-4-dehydrorhamnose reductase [Tetragenococcus koreensis]MDN6571723.1 dTDP-4-dehydrorhamnose reductase [Staphylococcus equorum]MDN6626679.1 dTDP-4-dehydrorhamnose reductase [Pisciglobus halotolerans]